MTCTGKESKQRVDLYIYVCMCVYIYTYMCQVHFAIQQKLTQQLHPNKKFLKTKNNFKRSNILVN